MAAFGSCLAVLVVLLYRGAAMAAGAGAGAQADADATLTADFAARDALPQSAVPVSGWSSLKGWGPKAAVYPPVAVPPGHDPVTWKRARVIDVAKKYVGLPYRHHHVPGWEPSGVIDPKQTGKGLDCSNFTAWVYNYGLGIKFTSDVGRQAEGAEAPGRVLAADEPLKPGDLLFVLKDDRTCVSHVVIYVDQDHIIDSHADGVAVRAFKGWYKTHLSHVRRILE